MVEENFDFYRREDCIDIEVKASGLTKEMEKDLLVEMGIEECEETETESKEKSENLENEIEKLKLEVEKVSKEDFKSVIEQNIDLKNTKTQDLEDEKNVEKENSDSAGQSNLLSNNLNKVLDDNSASDDNSSVYSEAFSNVQSIRSVSTTATIAPDVIKRRMKKTLERRARKNQSRKILIKGEASATTRVRRDNTDTIKQSTGSGIWGCD